MDKITCKLRGRGHLLKILMFLALAYFSLDLRSQVPNSYKFKIKNKPHVIKLDLIADVLLANAISAITMASYIFLLLRTTKIEIDDINISVSRGIFLRRKDGMDLTGVKDFLKEEDLVDRLFGVSQVVIWSKDVSDPKLHLYGLTAQDAERIYEHINLFSNKSLVRFVQGKGERSRRRKKLDERKNREDGE